MYELGSQRRKVTWQEHQEWFSDVLNQKNHILLIVEPDAGVVRLDRHDDFAVISIYLLPAFRGKGYGQALIQEACALGFMEWSITAVCADVRMENKASIKAFLRAGFCFNRHERGLVKLVLKREQ